MTDEERDKGREELEPEPESATSVAEEAQSLLDDEAALAEAMGLDGLADAASPLERAERERDEYLDALRRLQAEFDNYRKRVVRQQTELLERASESLVARLLPVLDALDLAVAHGAGGEGGDTSDVVVQIAALLRDTLNKEGLERIDAREVDFDPTIHDAVAHAPANESDDKDERDAAAPQQHRTIVDDVMRPGYRLKGRVIRPAMVRVRG